jgi:hypothetical protein
LYAHLSNFEGKSCPKWNADKEIQAIVAEINADDGSMNQYFGKYSTEKAKALKGQVFDRSVIAGRGLKYEKLDQLTVELLLGATIRIQQLTDFKNRLAVKNRKYSSYPQGGCHKITITLSSLLSSTTYFMYQTKESKHES